MKFKLLLAAASVTIICLLIFTSDQNESTVPAERREKDRHAFSIERVRYEYDLVKDPLTGKIPEGIFEKELQLARTLPVRSAAPGRGQRVDALNNYIPAGPNNIGGRTRAVAYDQRYNGTTNRVIIAGCVSGGIMRSADGGNSWTLVTPENDIHSFTTLGQDPRPGFQDTWYAAGGEAFGNSASATGAFYLGFGVWKSTDNGITWTKLTRSIQSITGGSFNEGTLEGFENPFDIVYNLAVSPTNGHLYLACAIGMIRSTDGGTSFAEVFRSSSSGNTSTLQMDVTVSTSGRVYLAVNGGLSDLTKRGVWYSETGNANSYIRIAGGQTLGTDSVDGWRGNSYVQTGGTYNSKRILIALAPSNNNIAYVFYENGLSSTGTTPSPEADLFRLEISGTSFTWSNRSANMPDFPNGNAGNIDPLSVQEGYDMVVRVFPTDPNIVFVGGTNLYRSFDGFATQNSTAWINGYRSIATFAELYPNGHPDIHELAFNPSNPAEAICANDGGIQKTQNVNAGVGSFLITPVSWTMFPNYQTLQYYYVTIDPEGGRNNFLGGAQDNSTMFRDRVGILGTQPQDSNNHIYLIGGDGSAVGISQANLVQQAQHLYGGSQGGSIRRITVSNGTITPNIFGISIRPNNLTQNPSLPSGFGEFITNFRLDQSNTEDLYYVNYNRLFRTTSASSVSAGGWLELTGVGSSVNPANPTAGTNISIRALAFTWGPYHSEHALFIGTTSGKIFRLDDPRNAVTTIPPMDITPGGLTGNVQEIAVNPNNDNEIMAIVTNYNTTSIWWTNNAKAAFPTWISAEGNLTLPSIRSCAIVTKKDAANNPITEYYVGTSVGLYSTTNISSGNPVWQREGGTMLNFAVVRSIAYRPVDNVMVIGTHGNGMYFTYLGSPNYIPTTPTAVNPITNDRNFIRAVFPSLAVDKVHYQTGNMFAVKTIIVRLTDISGREVYMKRGPYQGGTIPLNALAPGAYILNIYSDNNRYRHIQKIVKQ